MFHNKLYRVYLHYLRIMHRYGREGPFQLSSPIPIFLFSSRVLKISFRSLHCFSVEKLPPCIAGIVTDCYSMSTASPPSHPLPFILSLSSSPSDPLPLIPSSLISSLFRAPLISLLLIPCHLFALSSPQMNCVKRPANHAIP